MTYTEKELDQFLHGISLSLLSKKSAQHWRYDEETAKEIEWLEVLERKVRADKADRKTEPTISKMEQVDEDINVRSKDEPQTELKGFKRLLKGKDEPQTNADQHVQHVESVEPTWTKEEHEAFYTFLWNVINPNEMQDYIGMFESKDEQSGKE